MDLMPIIDLVESVGNAVGLGNSMGPNMHVIIHEDNSGALILAKTVSPQFTPRSKAL